MEPTKDELAMPVSKASYEPPCLRALGDIRQLTLGSSGCALDSGGTMQRHPLDCP